MGFFAAAGPLTFFVSHHVSLRIFLQLPRESVDNACCLFLQLMPREYELDTYENCYTCSSELLKMRIGSRVRTRIVGVRIDPTDIVSTATQVLSF
jgi:hypothetical protein